MKPGPIHPQLERKSRIQIDGQFLLPLGSDKWRHNHTAVGGVNGQARTLFFHVKQLDELLGDSFHGRLFRWRWRDWWVRGLRERW